MTGLVVNRLDDEGSLGMFLSFLCHKAFTDISFPGSDEWDQTDGELSNSSLLLEDRDGVSLIENNDL